MLLFFGAIAIAVIAIIFAYIFISIKIWKKWKYGKYCIMALTLFICCQLYWSINPPDSFYEKIYNEITDQQLPSDSEIIKGFATYPDVHGDYDACAYISIRNDEILNKSWKLDSGEAGAINCSSLDKILKYSNHPTFVRFYSRSDSTSRFRFIGVISDTTIIACRSSS
jgi:hypothetical protein